MDPYTIREIESLSLAQESHFERTKNSGVMSANIAQTNRRATVNHSSGRSFNKGGFNNFSNNSLEEVEMPLMEEGAIKSCT